MDEHENVVYDPWLTHVLRRDAYRLIVDDDLIQRARDPASREYRLLLELQARPVFIHAKVPTTAMPAIRFLETWGFNVVDTNVVFEKPAAPACEFVGHCDTRFAAPEDKNQVIELARRSFVYSRLHMDSAIPSAVADDSRAEWVGNFFAGERGDEMIVALVDKRVVGFLLLVRRNDDDLVIDLIAVDAAQRRKGIASDMIAYAESQLGGYCRMLVGTQVANIPSIRLYEKIGFRMCTSHYVFHYHNLPAEGK